MANGNVEQVGSPRELYQRPQSRFVAEFLGEVNWIDGVGVRPESVCISHERPLNTLRFHAGSVTSTTYLGNCVQVETNLVTAQRCIAQVQGGALSFNAGEQVYVWWDERDELPISPAQQTVLAMGS